LHVQTRNAQPVHAAFEFAQVLHAGDNFLAGVAALAKIHCAGVLQVKHLGNKFFHCFWPNLPLSFADAQQMPQRQASGL